MKAQRNGILLKIFSGPHIGAELALTPGDYTIGHSDKCDIVLQDSMIGPKHAILKVTDEYIDVLPLDSKTLLISGRPSDENEKTRLDYYSVITIGTTHIAIGKENGDWSKVLLPKLSAESFIEKPRDIPTKPETSFRRAIASYLMSFGKTRKFMSAFACRSARFSWRCKEKITRLRFYHKSLIIVSLGTLVSLAVYLTDFIKPNQPNPVDIQKRSLQVIMGVSATLGLTGINATTLDNGGILVSGYVDNNKQLEKILDETEIIEEIDIAVDIQVGNHLRNQAVRLLRQLGIDDVDIRYRQHGVLELSGYHANNKQWNKVKGIIKNDIPGIVSIETNEVKNLTNRKNSLLGLIEKTGLSKKIIIESKDNSIIVSGILANAEIQRLQAIIEEFKNDYGPRPKIEVDLIDSQNALEIDIKSVRIGEVPYIVTTSDARYLTGTFLPNGFSIKDITATEIVIQKNGIEVIYPLN